MASHHHLRHHPTAASYCYCCPPYSPCHHHPQPPPPPDCHPLYHPPPQPHLYSAQTPLPDSHQYHTHLREQYFREERETQHTIASLLRRIAALESALRGRSSSSPSSYSLRDAAARTIQTHFRAFLLRRSRTLRQLKDLASIKSAFGILKSSVSKQIQFDYDVIYHHAMDLALKLDTIQGGDPMIRDGKSSVRRDLNKFLDFIDGVYLEMRGFSSGAHVRRERSNVKIRVPNGGKKVANVKCGGLKNVTMDKLRGLVERIDKLAEELDEEENEVVESPDVFMNKHGVCSNKNGGLVRKLGAVQPKVKKSVRFADNGKVYRVLRRNSEPMLDEHDDDSVDRVDLVGRDFEGDLCREVDEIGVASKEPEDDDGDDDDADHSENGSDGEKDSRSYLTSGGNFERMMYNQCEVDDIVFSAPLPLKMDTRAELVDKRKKLGDNL